MFMLSMFLNKTPENKFESNQKLLKFFNIENKLEGFWFKFTLFNAKEPKFFSKVLALLVFLLLFTFIFLIAHSKLLALLFFVFILIVYGGYAWLVIEDFKREGCFTFDCIKEIMAFTKNKIKYNANFFKKEHLDFLIEEKFISNEFLIFLLKAKNEENTIKTIKEKFIELNYEISFKEGVLLNTYFSNKDEENNFQSKVRNILLICLLLRNKLLEEIEFEENNSLDAKNNSEMIENLIVHYSKNFEKSNENIKNNEDD